jgi:hypothetical protein
MPPLRFACDGFFQQKIIAQKIEPPRIKQGGFI